MKLVLITLLIISLSLVFAEEYNEDSAYEVVVKRKGPMGFEIGTGIAILIIILHRKWLVSCFAFNSRWFCCSNRND